MATADTSAGADRTPAQTCRAAAVRLRQTTDPAYAAPLAHLLEQIGMEMKIDDAVERDFPDHVPLYQRAVVDYRDIDRLDWTWALRTARAILGETE